jgi:hypothetical protein
VRGDAYTGIWWGNLRERDHLGDPSVDGRITLKWIFWKWEFGVSKIVLPSNKCGISYYS